MVSFPDNSTGEGDIQLLTLICVRDWSLIMGGGGAHVKCGHIKGGGGAGKVLAMLKEGGTTCFGVVSSQ